ncbi:MAG: hypothetical protein [Chaetfec virus UA24_144]|nr:MAG: hypothetical protein [Chaetfec virus UA24_144]
MAKVDMPEKEVIVEEKVFTREDVPDLPSNSFKNSEKVTEKRVSEKVVVGEVKRKKRGMSKQLKEEFFSDETPRSVFSYIWQDVLIPAAKDTLSDMVTEGIQMLLFGEVRGGKSSRHRGAGSRVSYEKYYRDSQPRTVRVTRDRYDFDDILLETHSEALDVVEHLECLIEQYSAASVADFYELVGIDSKYTDNKYGWTDLSDVTIRRTREGYLVDLPKTKRID